MVDGTCTKKTHLGRTMLAEKSGRFSAEIYEQLRTSRP